MSWFGRRVMDPAARMLGYARPSMLDGDMQLGEITVKQVRTFTALLNTFSKTYSFRYDEAQREDPAFALKALRDPFIQALLQERLTPLTRWQWSLTPPDPTHPEQMQRAKVYEEIVKKTPMLSRMHLSLGKGATWYGRYGAQVGVTPDRLYDGTEVFRLSQWKPVNGDKIIFSYEDDSPGIMVMPQAAFQFPREDITWTDRGSMVLRLRKPEYRRKFLLHQFQIEDADYFEPEMAGRVMGIGYRDFCYYGTHLRSQLISWATAFMEKVGTLGLLIFYYPEGNEAAKQQAELAAQEASNRNALAIPIPKGADKRAASAELLPANMTGVQFLVEIISGWWERHIERLFVGQSMSAGEGSSSLGGGERADFAKDTKFNLLAFDAEILADAYNSDLLPLLEDYNGDPGFGLRWSWALPDPNAKEKLEAVTKAASLPGKKLTFIANEVRELTGLSEPGPDDQIVGGEEQQPGMPGQPGAPGATGPEGQPQAQGDPLDQLFGGLEQPQRLASYAWVPHQVAAGPRKGNSVYKNTETGEVRDQLPKDRQAASQDQPAKNPQEHVRSLLSRVSSIPKDVLDKGTKLVHAKYQKLSARYGDKGAKAILASMVLLTPVPLPGTSLLPIAVAEGVRRLWQSLKGREAKPLTQEPQAAYRWTNRIKPHFNGRKRSLVHYRKDASGHEHKGKGPGGGQFTAQDSGSESSEDESKNKIAKPTGEPEYVKPEIYKQLIDKVKAKLSQAPKPSRQEIAKNRAGLVKWGANKYRRNLVGNSVDRAKRRKKLQEEFGDGTRCPCIYCGVFIGDAIGPGTLEQDKIYTTAQGGRYRLENLVPSCSGCNKERGDKPFSDFLAKKGL